MTILHDCFSSLMQMKAVFFLWLVGFLLSVEIARALTEQVSAETISLEDFSVFLNKKAASNTPQAAQEIGDGSWNMARGSASILRSGVVGNYHYEVIAGKENVPVTFVSCNDVTAYCAWKNSYQPSSDCYLPYSCDLGAASVDPFLKSNIVTFSLTRRGAAAEQDSGTKIVSSFAGEICVGVCIFAGLGSFGFYVHNNFRATQPGDMLENVAEPASREQSHVGRNNESRSLVGSDLKEVSTFEPVDDGLAMARSGKKVTFSSPEVTSERVFNVDFKTTISQYRCEYNDLVKKVNSDLNFSTTNAAETAAIYLKSYYSFKHLAEGLFDTIENNVVSKNKKTVEILVRAMTNTLKAATWSIDIENFDRINVEQEMIHRFFPDICRFFSIVPKKEVTPEDIKARKIFHAAGFIIDHLNALEKVLEAKKGKKISELFEDAVRKKLDREYYAKADSKKYFDKRKDLLAPKENEEPSEGYKKANEEYHRLDMWLNDHPLDYKEAHDALGAISSKEEIIKKTIEEVISLFEDTVDIAKEIIEIAASRKIDPIDDKEDSDDQEK